MVGLALAPNFVPSRAWWPADTVYAADFIGNRYMKNGTHIAQSAAMTFSRASEKLAQTGDGKWMLFAPDVPALTDRGLSCEPEETFYPVNSLFQGVTPGLVGAGGALPSNWTVLVSGGLSTEVLHTGMHGDAPYIRLRLFGTTTGTDFQIALNAYTQAAAEGETWTAALSLRHVAGETTGITPYIRVVEETTGSFVAASSTAFAQSGPFEREVVTRTLQSGSTNNVRARFRLTLPDTGVPIDLTADLLLPVLTASPVPGTPMLTNPTDVTLRTSDAATLLLPSGARVLTLQQGNNESATFAEAGDAYALPAGLVQPLAGAHLA